MKYQKKLDIFKIIKYDKENKDKMCLSKLNKNNINIVNKKYYIINGNGIKKTKIIKLLINIFYILQLWSSYF